MKKVLVIVDVPVLHNQYEMMLPVFMQIGTLIFCITNAIEQLTEGFFGSSGQEFLSTQSVILDDTKTLIDYNVMNGDHLYLI